MMRFFAGLVIGVLLGARLASIGVEPKALEKTASRQEASALAPAAPQAVCLGVDDSGGNYVNSAGNIASDPNASSLRAEFGSLMFEILGLTADEPISGAWVTFGSDVLASAGPSRLVDPAARRSLVESLGAALKPASGEDRWTSLPAGIRGCLSLIPGTLRPHTVFTSDNIAEGPAGDAAAQLGDIKTHLIPINSSRGGSIDVVRYGPPNPSAEATAREIASLGGGMLHVVNGDIDMLRVAVEESASVLGVPAGGWMSTVHGRTVIPLDFPAGSQTATVVAVRSSPTLSVSLDTELGPQAWTSETRHASIRAIKDSFSAHWRLVAHGNGSIYVAMLARTSALTASAPATTVIEASRLTGKPKPSAFDLRLGALIAGAVILLAAATVAVRRIRRRRGVLITLQRDRRRTTPFREIHGRQISLDVILPEPEPGLDGTLAFHRGRIRLMTTSRTVVLVPGVLVSHPTAPEIRFIHFESNPSRAEVETLAAPQASKTPVRR